MSRPYNRRDLAAVEAKAEQRKREDAAPRLRDEVDSLLSLRLIFEDARAGGGEAARSYARPIVVASAPAYFEIRCMEPRCTGRHDLTRAILAALRKSEVTLSGRSECNGMIGDVPCDHMLIYTGEASYRS